MNNKKPSSLRKSWLSAALLSPRAFALVTAFAALFSVAAAPWLTAQARTQLQTPRQMMPSESLRGNALTGGVSNDNVTIEILGIPSSPRSIGSRTTDPRAISAPSESIAK